MECSGIILLVLFYFYFFLLFLYFFFVSFGYMLNSRMLLLRTFYAKTKTHEIYIFWNGALRSVSLQRSIRIWMGNPQFGVCYARRDCYKRFAFCWDCVVSSYFSSVLSYFVCPVFRFRGLHLFGPPCVCFSFNRHACAFASGLHMDRIGNEASTQRGSPSV